MSDINPIEQIEDSDPNHTDSGVENFFEFIMADYCIGKDSQYSHDTQDDKHTREDLCEYEFFTTHSENAEDIASIGVRVASTIRGACVDNTRSI